MRNMKWTISQFLLILVWTGTAVLGRCVAEGQEASAPTAQPSPTPVAPISLVGHIACTGTSGCTTAAINTTGATLIIAAIGNYNTSNATCPTITDSKSNTWAQAGPTLFASPANSCVRYICGPAVGAGHTFTIDGTFSALEISVWNNTATSECLDQNAGNQSYGAATISTNSIIPAGNNSLVFAMGAAYLSPNEKSITFTAPGQAFTAIDSQFSQAGHSIGSADGYFIQLTAGPVSTTYTTNSKDTSDGITAIIAAFKHN
jgi:hypothetical protein